MIFLINYDRGRGTLVEIRRFADSERDRASRERIDLEVMLAKAGIVREVVLLQAASEDALRKTHRRYFENLRQLST